MKLKTRGGREIEPPKQAKVNRGKDGELTTAGLAKNQREVDRWLLTEGLREAAIREDFHAVHLFAGIDQVKMTEGERVSLNLYLWGVEEVRLTF